MYEPLENDAAADCYFADLFCYGATKALTTHIQFLYRQTNHQALNILVHTHKLKEHFSAINRYLLLEQGDLTQYLVEAIGKELCKDARHIYRHDLAAALENGIRLSNARHDSPDVLRRLDARLLEVSPGDAGWDVFCIDYHVQEPLDTILTRKTMAIYQQLSCFLWKLKRVEYALSFTWKARMRLAQELRTSSVYSDLHACLLTWAQMNHVIVQVQYHINFEALASTWADFHACLDDVNQDIDGILKTHKTYLNTLQRRCMLRLKMKGRDRAALQEVVESVLAFQIAHERLHRFGTRLARREMTSRQADLRERSFDMSVVHAALPSLDDDEDEDEDDTTLDAIRAQVDSCRQRFQESVNDLKDALLEDDSDAFRGLIVRLNFNQYYSTAKDS
ncbi:Gamma-tubulin complex component 3 [Thoreauomyces humboldtii]|nr:Gamma-tubulin complex component 3 [Thoreauomyces humboldtii]